MEALQNGVKELKGVLLPHNEEMMVPGRSRRVVDVALTALAIVGAALLAITLFEPLLIVVALPAALLLGVTVLVSSALSGRGHPRGSWGNMLGGFGGGAPRARSSFGNGWGHFGGGRSPQQGSWLNFGGDGRNPGRGWGVRQVPGMDGRRR